MNSLDGVRVLDLSRVLAGPWCTQTLADLGADVIKIERPLSGDDTRGWGPPFLKDNEGHTTQEAAYYLGTNRNKRSLTCDISQKDGQDLIKQLVAHCDVFIENFKVGDMQRYGLDYASLKLINPKLVYCSITGFGQTGPYKDRAGYDYAVQGMGGLMSITGDTDAMGGGPQKVGVAVADLFTGMYSCVAILAALRHANLSGSGQYIDMALLDTQVAMLANLGANYLVDGQFNGNVPTRMGNAHQNIVPYQVFQVANTASFEKDFIILAVGNDRQFAKFCEVAGHPWHQDARYALNQNRVKNRSLLVPELEKVMLTRSKSDWLNALEKAKVPCGAINNFAEVFSDPHVRSRGMVQTWVHPKRSQIDLVANPIKMSATPVQQKNPPPLLGEHTFAILQEVLGMDKDHIQALIDKNIL
jgi:crotonobetainyl-CoA:carnitine CoA-transferase CaiB-like acyl-CoA transferase